MADELDHYRQLLMDDRRATHALAAEARAALAQPEPQGPTDEEIAECLIDAGVDTMEGESDGTGRTYWEGWHDQVMAGVRAVLARWGRPAIGPVPQLEGVHYAWELHDAEGEWQAGGSANSLKDVQREGNRYLQTYSQDGPHKLIIERHCVTTIEPVPKREAEQ
jgi:hypothetical protein